MSSSGHPNEERMRFHNFAETRGLFIYLTNGSIINGKEKPSFGRTENKFQ